MVENPQHCYLCGQLLTKPTNVDHVPPKQIYAAAIRKTDNTSKLLTIPVHRNCNKSYQLDEDYFIHTLIPFAPGSYAGNAVFNEKIARYEESKNTALMYKVLNEFDGHPNNIILPPDKIAKHFEGGRINRVVWKIVRGLHFHHHRQIIPEEIKRWVTITAPGESPPEHFAVFMQQPGNDAKGIYPGAFDYRFRTFNVRGGYLHYWAILLWDRIIITLIFHTPSDFGSLPPDGQS
jgi:hypothetical protein